MFRIACLLTTLCVVLLVAACSATRPPYPPDFSVALQPTEVGEFVLDVYDSAELLVDAQINPDSTGGAMRSAVVARPEARQIDVSWTGGACAHRPFLHVRGGTDDLDLELVPDPSDLNLVVAERGCPAVLLMFSVTLTLAEPVEQANVTLTQPD